MALAIGASIITGGDEAGDEIRNPKKVTDYPVAQEASLTKLKEVIQSPQSWVFSQHKKTDLNSFVGYPLYGIKGNPGIHELGPETLFDGIELSWWRENNLEDYQYEDGGSRDADGEGFSNKEEHDAKTDPNNAESHPSFITKLKFVEALKPEPFRIQWSQMDAERGAFTFRAGNAPSSLDVAGVGDTFPKEPHNKAKAYANRFKIIEKGRGLNATTNREEDFYMVEDLHPLKSKRQFKLWYSSRKAYYDWSAMFQLDTPNGGEPFKVEEGGEFSLPFKEGGKGYKFLLEERKGNKFGNPSIEMKEGDAKKVVPLGLAPAKEENDGGL